MIQQVYQYAATLVRVIDGDTVIFNVDLGFLVHVVISVRLWGINAPELHTPNGPKSKEELAKRLTEATSIVLCTTVDKSDKQAKQEKYGRWLGVIYRDGSYKSENNWLVEQGLAVPYNGHGPMPKAIYQ